LRSRSPRRRPNASSRRIGCDPPRRPPSGGRFRDFRDRGCASAHPRSAGEERRAHALIRLGRIDHVCLRVRDLDEAAARWCVQLGLVERSRVDGRAYLACNDEPYSLELVTGGEPGYDHVAFELHRSCSLADAKERLEALGVPHEEREGSLWLADPDERAIQLVPHRVPASEVDRWPQHARPSSTVHVGGPRRLGHVNSLTGAIGPNVAFYTEVLGMTVSDWLGEAGVWFHIDSEHHVMALVETGQAHFHHLAFDVVDIGKMRDLLDHLARHGRWVAWGPTRHGIAGNIATYVRIVEEPCFVELYCDMEQLADDHEPRVYPDDRYSSNTWGPLPPRSYFRFDPVAIEFERESWETRGRLLPPSQETA
jgi:catechol 2,3-dioxygenase-like lactoylglutathione lyase family enzyme